MVNVINFLKSAGEKFGYVPLNDMQLHPTLPKVTKEINAIKKCFKKKKELERKKKIVKQI